jgi:hypothetical protein
MTGSAWSILVDMLDRAGLADFLRRHRELLRPADFRLEQCRGANPAEPIVASPSRALRCALDERDHLCHLAGPAPPTRRAGRHVVQLSPAPLRLCDRDG